MFCLCWYLTGPIKLFSKQSSCQWFEVLCWMRCHLCFQIGEQKFTAHRIVLAATIPYFQAMFTHDMVESTQDEISMKGIEARSVLDIDWWMWNRYDTGLYCLLTHNNLKFMDGTHHCSYWCPGAKAPGHQYPQCWLYIHYIGPISYYIICNGRQEENQSTCWKTTQLLNIR